MYLTYENTAIRGYCDSTNTDLSNNRFSINEILVIRMHIADLRSAPSLADAPINYKLIKDNKGQSRLIIDFDGIRIICSFISNAKNPKPNKIKRVKVLDIVRIDLHLATSKAYSA